MRYAAAAARIAFTVVLITALSGAWVTARADDGAIQTLTHKGLQRRYLVRLPYSAATPPEGAKLPVVLVLHGAGGNAFSVEAMTGFTEKARREGFIVVYPEGTGPLAGRYLTWNAGHCCGSAMREEVDDVGFIVALLERLIATCPIDPRRVYATGMSNGGMMAHLLGIHLSTRMAAIAPVVATLFGDEQKPQRAVAALMLNGMRDTIVPATGGPPDGRFRDFWDGTSTLPAQAQATFWAQANGCAAQPLTSDHGAYRVTRFDCPANADVEIYLFKEGGHVWPRAESGRRGADTPAASPDATDLIWDFFKTRAR